MNLSEKTVQFWGMEPARIVSFVVAALTLAVSLGFQIDPDMRDAIIALVSSALVLAGGFVTRREVAPKKKVEAAMGKTALERIAAVKKEEIGTMGTLRAG